MTFSNATLSSLGFTPGTYIYTWGSAQTADTLIVTSIPNIPTVVPEAGTWFAALCAIAGVIVIRLQHADKARRVSR
jgi:hypothetical protein